jgi:hypothetical protein
VRVAEITFASSISRQAKTNHYLGAEGPQQYEKIEGEEETISYADCSLSRLSSSRQGVGGIRAVDVACDLKDAKFLGGLFSTYGLPIFVIRVQRSL